LSFVYVALHLTAWIWLDMGLRFDEMIVDLYKRPYVILGMVGFLTMLPLAVTSSNTAIRRMGAATWARLHRLAPSAILAAILHLVLLSKVWNAEVLVYLVLTALLLGYRLLPRAALRRRTAA